MLRISVFQFRGEPPIEPLSCEFNERGGTIGRDLSNQLALPDPERHMSRVQAEVQYANGTYLLIDHGSNATSVNGHPLGKGTSAPLRDGDEIGIAFYSMRVELLRAAPAFSASPAAVSQPATSGSDPLGLFAPTSSPPATPPPSSFGPTVAPSPGPAVPGLFDPAPAAPSQADPFAQLAASSQPATPAAPAAPPAPPSPAAFDDPFSVFAAPPAKPAAPVRGAPAASSDDPFAAFGARPKAPEPTPASPLGIDMGGDPLGMGLQSSEPSSLDALFSLERKSPSQDPFAGSALGDPLFGGGGSASGGTDDPLALLSGGSPVAPATERNDAPVMREAFVPPKVIRDEPAPAAAPEIPRPGKPRGGVVSWDGESPLSASAISAPQPEQAPAAPKAPPAPPVKAPVATPEPPAAKPLPKAKVVVEGLDKAAPAAPSPASATTDANTVELLNALARGLGVTGLNPPGGLTPQLMEHVGQMLREAAHGTIELLLARAVTKREVRAELTMIVSKNNNPLKFSPDVNFALMQLIAPQGAGFMAPVEAMRDAYDDLRAHQIGFMAGMRGALSGVLARFKPADLEARLTDKSFLDSVMPGNRKAKLWDLYEQRFAEISREAEDNFHTFFGREFLKAYEEQLERLQDDHD
ncbi:MAG: regulatory protein [Rhodocyclales bacterium]|nr:regulatory protein [Rhodocyclales bacterium]